jgi:hypothetical protein
MDNIFQGIWKIQPFKKKLISVPNILNEKNEKKIQPGFLNLLMDIKKNMTSAQH